MNTVPLCSVAPLRFKQTKEPCHLLDAINPDTSRVFHIMVALVMGHPASIERAYLLKCGAFNVQGPICGPAALEFWIAQLNVDLNCVGWEIIESGNGFRLLKN